MERLLLCIPEKSYKKIVDGNPNMYIEHGLGKCPTGFITIIVRYMKMLKR